MRCLLVAALTVVVGALKPTAAPRTVAAPKSSNAVDRSSFLGGVAAAAGAVFAAPAPVFAAEAPAKDEAAEAKAAAEAAAAKAAEDAAKAAKARGGAETFSSRFDAWTRVEGWFLRRATSSAIGGDWNQAAEEARLAELKKKKDSLVAMRKADGRMDTSKPSPAEIWANIGKYYYDDVYNDAPKPNAPAPAKPAKK
mmetsp:Transcript_19926/g.59363  ORF Transcript_19926/g.59363 Transcript_19926/m.59363 type:complete len:196 (-) Transcript_19926:74-661(-)